MLRAAARPCAPGQRWDYSNYNFSLLGLVIEHVSGRPYADYVREEFAVPLGLTDTGYCEDGTAVPGRGQDYESGPHGPQPTSYWRSPRSSPPAGSARASPTSCAGSSALDEGRVVSAATLQSMRTPTRLADGSEADYGFGTRMGWTAGHRKLGHTGGGAATRPCWRATRTTT